LQAVKMIGKSNIANALIMRFVTFILPVLLQSQFQATDPAQKAPSDVE
jgi:hypothetical protein